MGKLTGQVAIVMGASSGIGRATACALADEGVSVVVSARREALLRRLEGEIASRGMPALSCVADSRNQNEVINVAHQTLDRFGRIDVLVNAVGINVSDRGLAKLQRQHWDQIIATNLSGAFHCTQAVLPQMKEQRNGLIIHICSVSGKSGDNSGAAYQASKHGMVGLAYATMFEERLNGIRVTLIFPGLCDTELLSNRPNPPSPALREKMMHPDDIAQACVFVASLPARTYVPELVMMPGALQCVGHTSID